MIYKISMILFSNKLFYKFFKKCSNSINHILGFGNYDFVNSGEKFLIKSISNDITSVLDIGAGEGTFFELVNSLLKNQFNYHAFEPHPNSYRILETKLKKSRIDKFKIYNKAVGNKEEKLTLYSYKNISKPNHSSLFKGTFDVLYQKESESIEVDVLKLDTIVDELGDIDLIKIDTEGNLSNVLIGAQKVIKIKSLKYILFELNTNEYIQGITFYEISNLIGDEFKFYKLLRNGMVEITNKKFLIHEFGCNIVAKRKLHS